MVLSIPPATLALGRTHRRSMPAVLMRAGTSKGLFIHRSHLPSSQSDWAEPLLAAMGSRHADPKQLDGVGGAASVTSKVAVVGPPLHPNARKDIDVEYTFVQVAVGQAVVDLSGNCGNMVAGVGPFAVQEGLVVARPGEEAVEVRILNTNTNKIIVETVPVDPETGEVREDGDCSIPGVACPGAAIKVAFCEPGGSMTGALFPTGNRSEHISVQGIPEMPDFEAEVTLFDCANPLVLVDAASLPTAVRGHPIHEGMTGEAIRVQGAVRMGLAQSIAEASRVRGTPKLVFVSRPPDPSKADIAVLAYSMGKPHPTVPLTGAVGLASAACIEGTVLHRLANGAHPDRCATPPGTPDAVSGVERDKQRKEDNKGTSILEKKVVRLEHGRGVMEIEVWLRRGGDGTVGIERGLGVRTARRLFEGRVSY